MKPLLLFMLLIGLPVIALAAPSRKEALAAIATIQKDPWSDAATDAFQALPDYLPKDGSVRINLGRELVPWAFDDAQASNNHEVAKVIFLRVYFAANLKSQLMADKPQDDPYAGWIAVIDTYRGVKNAQKLSFPSIDRLAALEEKGQLKDFAAKALKAE